MARVLKRIKLAFTRGSARADSVVAAMALFLAGHSWASDRPVASILTGAMGLVFLFASGDYSWRKGFVAGKREGGGR